MSARGENEGRASAQERASLRLRDLVGGDRTNGKTRDPWQPRVVMLSGRSVDYRLIRTRRRTIGMEIGLAGLAVRAPRWVSIRAIESTLRERAAWIVRSLDEWRSLRRDVFPRAWKTGAPILYLGRDLVLSVVAARTMTIGADLLNLTVRHPEAHDEVEIAAFVGKWLREEALRHLAPCVAELAARVAPSAPTLKLSNARSEWGSCNQKGVILLNWRLVQLPPFLARYVVAHEVAHLVELNHSPRFWQLVETLFPGHADARRSLDEWTALLDA